MLTAPTGDICATYKVHFFPHFMLCKGHTNIMLPSFRNDYAVGNLQFVVA